MVKRGRPGLSDEQKQDAWDRRKDGQSLSEIGRCWGLIPAVVHNVIKANGGVVPARRTRSSRCLSLAEREEISRGLACGDSMRGIAGRLSRRPSTLSREINRNGGTGPLSSQPGRCGGLGPSPPTQDLQTGPTTGPATSRCCQTSEAVVTRADQWLAGGTIP